MANLDDAFALSLLFHLNSEPRRPAPRRAKLGPEAEFKTLATLEPGLGLPTPSPSALTDLMAARHSCRNFAPEAIALDQLAAVLHAGYGITGVRRGDGDLLTFRRAVPSAEGIYPLELYVVCHRVERMKSGLYHFNARDRSLEHVSGARPITDLLPGLMHDDFVRHASAITFIAAVLPRALGEFGARGYRHVLVETGHCAQNMCLRATELGLGTLCVGDFYDHYVNSCLGLDGRKEVALYGIALGYSAGEYASSAGNDPRQMSIR